MDVGRVWRVTGRLNEGGAMLVLLGSPWFLRFQVGGEGLFCWSWAGLTLTRLAWMSGRRLGPWPRGAGIYVRVLTALDAIALCVCLAASLEALGVLDLAGLCGWLSPGALAHAAADYAALALLLALGLVLPNGLRADALVPHCSCGYCLVGNVTGVCPECGRALTLGGTAGTGEAAVVAAGLESARGGGAPFKAWFRKVRAILIASGAVLYLVASRGPGKVVGWRSGMILGALFLGVLVLRLLDTIGRADLGSTQLARRVRRYAQVVLPADAFLAASVLVLKIYACGRSDIASLWYGCDLLVVWVVLALACLAWFGATHLVLRQWLLSETRKDRGAPTGA